MVLAFVLGPGVFADMTAEIPEAGIKIGEEETIGAVTQAIQQGNGETTVAPAACTPQPLKNGAADNSTKPVITQIQIGTTVTNCLEESGKKCCNLELEVDSEEELVVTALPQKDDQKINVEIWYLTDAEATDFAAGTFKKDGKRGRQYIFGTPATTYKNNTFTGLNVSDPITATLGEVAKSKAFFSGGETISINHGDSLAVYAQRMADKGFENHNYYIMVESTVANSSTGWLDSVPIPINLKWGNLEFMAAAAFKNGQQYTWDKDEETGTAFKATINKDYFSENGLLLFYQGADPGKNMWLSVNKKCTTAGLAETNLSISEAVINDNANSKIPLEETFWINPSDDKKYFVPRANVPSGGFGGWYITEIGGVALKDIPDEPTLKFYACQDNVAEADITIVLQGGDTPTRSEKFEGEKCGTGFGQTPCPKASEEVVVPSSSLCGCKTVLCWMACIDKHKFVDLIFR